MTRPPTAPGRDLNLGTRKLEASALLTELMKPDVYELMKHLSLTSQTVNRPIQIHWYVEGREVTRESDVFANK